VFSQCERCMRFPTDLKRVESRGKVGEQIEEKPGNFADG